MTTPTTPVQALAVLALNAAADVFEDIASHDDAHRHVARVAAESARKSAGLVLAAASPAAPGQDVAAVMLLKPAAPEALMMMDAQAQKWYRLGFEHAKELAAEVLAALSHPTQAAEPVQAAQVQQEAALREALQWAVNHIERNTCRHESTHRGGAIWTICDDCGSKWADDEGGFEPYAEPPELTRAHELLATPPQAASPAAPMQPATPVVSERRLSLQDAKEWGERHDINMTDTELFCAFEDAATAHLLSTTPGAQR